MPRSGPAPSPERRHILASELDAAAGNATARAGMSHQRQRDSGLSRSAFADQRDDLAFRDVEVHALDDFDAAAGIGVGLDLQVTDFNEVGPSCAPVADLLRAGCRSAG